MKISVTLANYNHAKYLRKCLDGVLTQSYTDLEMIITDDGSTDESRDILLEYQRRDKRIKLEILDTNQGAMAAFQRCYARVTGDLFYATASDDYLCDSAYFENVVHWLKIYPSAAGAFARQKVVWNDTGELVSITGKSPVAGFIPPERCLKSYLTDQLLACGLSSVWKFPMVQAIGGYPPDLGPFSELYVNHALPSLSGVIFISKVVGVAQIPRDSSAYNSNMEICEKARFCARLESLLRALPASKSLPFSLFDEFRQRMIDEMILETQFNHKTLEVVDRAIREYLTYGRNKTLRAGWTKVEQALDEMISLFNGSAYRVCEEFENITGVPSVAGIQDYTPEADNTARLSQAPKEASPNGARDLERIEDRILKVLFQHLSWFRSLQRENAGLRVAAFGAGSHTKHLIRIWNALELPILNRVLVSDNALSTEYMGVRISRISDITANEIDLVLLSSEPYECEMSLSCMEYLPSTPRLAFWNANLSLIPSYI